MLKLILKKKKNYKSILKKSPKLVKKLQNGFQNLKWKIPKELSKIMNKLVLSLLLSKANAAGDWNYLQHGADWGEGCTDNQTNQTPINLFTPDHPEFSKYPIIEGHRDQESVRNLFDAEVVYNEHSSQINFKETEAHHGLTSSLPK